MTYSIYRLKDTEENAIISFMCSSLLEKYKHWPPNPESYENIWEEDLPDQDSVDLEAVYTKFNIHKPEGFRHHSMSVGDIVVMTGKNPGAYFCDDYGFKSLPDFYTEVSQTIPHREV